MDWFLYDDLRLERIKYTFGILKKNENSYS